MGDLKPNEIAVCGNAWRANGGKIMRMIDERFGDDSYKIRFEKVDVKVDEELFRTVLVFNNQDDAQIYRLIADRGWHGR
jgi:hypothetical protein